MRETPNYMGEKEMGCGLIRALFYLGGGGGGTVKVKKPPPVLPPLPAMKPTTQVKNSGNYGPKRQQGSSRSSKVKFLEMAKSSKHPSNFDSTPKVFKLNKESSQLINTTSTRKLRKESTFTETEPSMKVAVRQKSTQNGTLYRVSSDNAEVIGHLGNLNRTRHVNNSANNLSQNKQINTEKTDRRRSLQLGNIYGGNLIYKIDSEVFKNMGNQKYKQGRFEEAISLYNKAIGMDASKASYYSNRSAALIGLGRLLEAVFDCRVALQIEPFYHRAHYCLATLYLRLGEAEKAVYLYKCAGSKAKTKDILQAQALNIQVGKCVDARKIQDWNTLLKETHTTLHLGADSAPQIYAMQTEALLNLHRHQEAYSAAQRGPNFNVYISTQLFGSTITANLLTLRAQAYIAAGRFEEAMTAVQRATDLDPSDEVTMLAKKVKGVAMAREKGNHLFKEYKFLEACIAYSEGLKHEPYNSVLLYNRAACHYKLERFKNAIEDCTAAINLRPSYAKPRFRRARCNVKRWKAAIQDYEVLIQENPGNGEVEMALVEARVQLLKQHIEEVMATKYVSNLVNFTGKELTREKVRKKEKATITLERRG